LFPDAIIILKLDDEQIIKRLLPPRFEAWQTKMKTKKEKKRLKAEKKKEKLVIFLVKNIKIYLF
jgi:hypothetical protein